MPRLVVSMSPLSAPPIFVLSPLPCVLAPPFFCVDPVHASAQLVALVPPSLPPLMVSSPIPSASPLLLPTASPPSSRPLLPSHPLPLRNLLFPWLWPPCVPPVSPRCRAHVPVLSLPSLTLYTSCPSPLVASAPARILWRLCCSPCALVPPLVLCRSPASALLSVT